MSKSRKYIILFILTLSVTATVFVFLGYKAEREMIQSKIASVINNVGEKTDELADAEFLSDLNKCRNGDMRSFSNFELSEIYEGIKELMIKEYQGKDNAVPVFHIYTNDMVGSSLSKQDGYVDAEIVYLSKEKTVKEEKGSIKVRGNSTSVAEKKPYNIRFSDKVDIAGFGKEKKYVLLADCFDPTMMRNFVFFNLAKKLELPYTSEAQYVELYLDGCYKGTFILCEAVEAGKDLVDISVKNGDFLVEIEQVRDEKGVVYITTESGWRFAVCEPEKPKNNQIRRISEKLNQLDAVLNSADYQAVCSMIDVDSFVKYYLVNEYAKTADFDFSSVKIFYKDGLFYAGPVWDFDLSSGNVNSTAEPDYYNEGVSYKGLKCNVHLWKSLLQYDEFRSSVREYYENNLKALSEIYEEDGFIDSLLEEYGSVFEKNYASAESGGAGWIVGKQYSQYEKEREDTFAGNVDYLRYWLENRLEYLNINGLW